MDKLEFQKRRTEIIGKMLDNPDRLGIYNTTEAFESLDKLFDEIDERRITRDGDKTEYLCLENYKMTDGEIAFIKGKTYLFDKNRQTESELFPHDMSGEKEFDLYFKRADSTQSDVLAKALEALEKSNELFMALYSFGEDNKKLPDVYELNQAAIAAIKSL